jgi:hypothetical protein
MMRADYFVRLDSTYYGMQQANFREQVAKKASCFCMGKNDPSLPTRWDEHSDKVWIIDADCYWRVIFSDNDKDKYLVQIVMDRRNEEAEKAFATWLAYRLGGVLETKVIN